ncbi:alpha/beta fold hydrolase [Actinosynnema sp. NPDC023587]|uniref:thioesterase II family protein n=1 Tax=Actinosynnema sp. NPDC023587 TaxID=3154695 RepID=UPI00340E9ED3
MSASPGKVRLYCFAHAGGDARSFAPWSAELPEHVEVCPVQLPGRGRRLRDRPVATLAAALADVLPVIDTGGPYALFGHSLGAVLAYEAASRLARGPVRLFVSAHRAPHLPLREPVIHDLPRERFVARLAETGGIPRAVLDSPGFLRALLPALRADFTISETYRYVERPPLDCPVDAYGGLDDPDVTPAELDEWQRHTTGRYRRKLFPGNHSYPETARGSLLAELAAALPGT